MKLFQAFVYSCLFSLALVVNVTTKAAEQKIVSTEESKPVSTGDKIYTWIDKNGNRIYSDVPQDGAKVMEISKGTDYTPPNQVKDYSKIKPKVVPEEKVYSNFTIASPSNDATVRNNQGNLQLALDIRPALEKGHLIKVELDGVEVRTAGSSIISLTNIDRGTHVLVAHIVTADGEVLDSTPPVTVHLHRAIYRKKPNN